jgi:hypothetical protein
MRTQRFGVVLLFSICVTFSYFVSLMNIMSLLASSKESATSFTPSSPPRRDGIIHQQEDDLPIPIQTRLVQIGANDGSNSGNDDTIRKLLSAKSTHALLVEPNPQVFEMLKSTIATEYNNATTRIKPMNALVCPKGADLTFFVVHNEKLVEDYPNAPHWVRYQLSSLNLESVITGIRGFLSQMRKGGKFKGSRARTYIQNVTIACTPFLAVLEQGGFAPRDVDVLAVDTEGYDAKVVTNALQVPGFLPRTIIFEVKGLPVDERDALLDILEERGYSTDCPKVGGVRVKKCPEQDVTAHIIRQPKTRNNKHQPSSAERIHYGQARRSTSTIRRLVQIGANDGSNSGNDDTVRKLLADNNTHALLVEANPQIFDMLKSTVATNYKNAPRIQPLNALVCPKGVASYLGFFVVNERKLVQDYPDAPHWLRYQVSSVKQGSVRRELKGFLHAQERNGTFKGMRAPAYMNEITISCTPFAGVLELGGFAPEDVDILAVDVEGFDAKVVTDALQVPGFLPQTIIFEAKHLPADELSTLLDILEEQRGYSTDCPKVGGVRPKKCPGVDVVATRYETQSGT